MTQQQIQQLFQLRYNQNNWKQFLGQAFANARLLSTPEILTGINADVATQALRLGYIVLNEDGIERHIAVYDVTLARGIVLERNRVGLRNLLRKYWKDIDAAFIVYHRPENPNWRFSYVSELSGFDAEGELIKVKTEPKRYTYILGESESCSTAAERFAIITKKGSKTTLDDVKDSFSVEKLSKAFFEEYKTHYENFVEFLTGKRMVKSGGKWKEKQTGKSNPQLAYIFNGDEKEARDFNKKLLGRIVFLYFIQKKGWMGVPEKSDWGQGDPNFLWNLFDNCSNKGIFYSEYLSKLFFDTLNTQRKDDLIELIPGERIRIPFLNGGLFEEDNKLYRNLIFPAELFENLFRFFNQYNFTIYEDDPNDHTVAVDPEMLGHIFENLLEDNKDKGAYYTPREIVHYMCQESLIEYLCTTLQIEDEAKEKEAVTNLLKKKEIDDILKPELQNINNALDKVKICDPAIGSGAFPMGLLKEIFTAKQTLYTFKHGNTEGFDASGVKLNIIQNSIYGVDIEKGAVDIARLRFWLSLIVDEPKPKALPNLDYKIVVGNSLVSKLGDDIIDIDWDKKNSVGKADEYIKKLRNSLIEISKKQEDYFIAKNKGNLKNEIRSLKIDILINQLSFNKELYANQNVIKVDIGFGLKPAEIKKNTEVVLTLASFNKTIEKLKKLKTKPEEPLHFFDWKLNFPEVMNEQVTDKVGFDIVIGNPPYVSGRKGAISNTDKQIFNRIYFTAEYQLDTYVLFTEKASLISKKQAVVSFIIPNTWLANHKLTKIRKFLLEKHTIGTIINMPSDSFENAVVDTVVLIFKNEIRNSDIKIGNIKNSKFVHLYDTSPTHFLSNKNQVIDIHINQFVKAILLKVEINSNKVDELCYVNRGVHAYRKDGYGKSKYAVGYQTKEDYEKKSYHSQKKEDETYFPEVRGRNLQPYFYETNDKFISWGNWLAEPRDWTFFSGKRIYLRKIVGNTFFACFVDKDNIADQSIYIAKLRRNELSHKYLLALFNSKALTWYFRLKNNEFDDFFPQIKVTEFKQLPIRLLDRSNQEPFITVVNQIITLKSEGKDTTALEQQIDNMVYKLYELSYEEVKVIDPEFPLSEQEYEAIKV